MDLGARESGHPSRGGFVQVVGAAAAGGFGLRHLRGDDSVQLRVG